MLLNRKRSAEYLGISTETLDRLKAAGKIRFVQIGDRVLWSIALLDEFIQICTQPATTSPSSREAQTIAKAAGGVA